MDNCNSTKVPLLNTLTYLKDPCIATSEDGHIGMHRRGGIGDRIKMVSTDTVWYCPDPSQHSSNESARLRTPHYGSMEGNRGRSSLGAQEAVPPIVAEPGISSTDATNNTAGLWPLVTRRQHCQLANPVLLRPPSPHHGGGAPDSAGTITTLFTHESIYIQPHSPTRYPRGTGSIGKRKKLVLLHHLLENKR